jgi:putative addiction module CopG family antidote
MSAALTDYWQDFINQMVASGRYNNRSEVIRAGLRSLEERELTRETREFDQIFSGGRAGEPDSKTVGRMVARRKRGNPARGRKLLVEIRQRIESRSKSSAAK